MNVVSFVSFPSSRKKNTTWSGRFSSFHSHQTNVFSQDFLFHTLWIILRDDDRKYIPMRIWPYASWSLHVTDLETIPEQIIWIWNWRPFRLNLRWTILTSAALTAFLSFFSLLCFPLLFLLPPALLFVLKLAVSLFVSLHYFTVSGDKESIQIVFYVTRGNQVIVVCSASVGQMLFFINLFKTHNLFCLGFFWGKCLHHLHQHLTRKSGSLNPCFPVVNSPGTIRKLQEFWETGGIPFSHLMVTLGENFAFETALRGF